MRKLFIYTDGACSGNPGPGGWGFAIYDEVGEMIFSQYGSNVCTTNNAMEMRAVIQAFDYIKQEKLTDFRITVYSDSKYIIDGIKEWLPNWKKRHWKTSTGKDVANLDLWKIIDQINTENDIIWSWVKGHSDNPSNNYVDKLACNGRDQAKAMRERSVA